MVKLQHRAEDREVLAHVRQLATFYNGRRPANTTAALMVLIERLDTVERQLAGVRTALNGNGNGRRAA
jgi:hypothetical protein